MQIICHLGCGKCSGLAIYHYYYYYQQQQILFIEAELPHLARDKLLILLVPQDSYVSKDKLTLGESTFQLNLALSIVPQVTRFCNIILGGVVLVFFLCVNDH